MYADLEQVRADLDSMEDYLRKVTSCFVKLHVRNPIFEPVKATFKVRLFDGYDELGALTGLEALGWDTLCLKGDSFGGWVEAGYATEEGLPEPYETMNTVELDADLEATITEMFASIPEGWGGITAEQLNTELAENPDIVLIDARTEPGIFPVVQRYRGCRRGRPAPDLSRAVCVSLLFR